jgi:microcystin-dependent protein
VSEPFLAEIRMVGFTFAPRNWALCDGQILPINQYQALFSLLGTTYGGDGRTTFALPDLRGRAPVHFGSGPSGQVYLGSRGGAETVTLTPAQLPQHTHNQAGSTYQGRANDPALQRLARQPRRGIEVYTPPANLVALGSDRAAGGSQAHDNMQPFLVLNFCIALTGVFPSRN